MSYREHGPGADAAWLDCFWTAEHGSGAHRVLPDGCVDILVDPDTGEARVVGAMTCAVVVEQEGSRRWVAARFRPGRARALFGGVVAELTDEAAVLEDVLPDAGRWLEQLVRCDGPGAAVQVLQTGLSLGRRPGPNERVARAVDRLWVGDRVGEVADALGWSRQHLSRRVRDAVGYRPSLLRRVGRLSRLLARLPADPCWTDLAYAHGYADSAHLTHDFRDLVGLPPSVWCPSR